LGEVRTNGVNDVSLNSASYSASVVVVFCSADGRHCSGHGSWELLNPTPSVNCGGGATGSPRPALDVRQTRRVHDARARNGRGVWAQCDVGATADWGPIAQDAIGLQPHQSCQAARTSVYCARHCRRSNGSLCSLGGSSRRNSFRLENRRGCRRRCSGHCVAGSLCLASPLGRRRIR